MAEKMNDPLMQYSQSIQRDWNVFGIRKKPTRLQIRVLALLVDQYVKGGAKCTLNKDDLSKAYGSHLKRLKEALAFFSQNDEVQGIQVEDMIIMPFSRHAGLLQQSLESLEIYMDQRRAKRSNAGKCVLYHSTLKNFRFHLEPDAKGGTANLWTLYPRPLTLWVLEQAFQEIDPGATAETVYIDIFDLLRVCAADSLPKNYDQDAVKKSIRDARLMLKYGRAKVSSSDHSEGVKTYLSKPFKSSRKPASRKTA